MQPNLRRAATGVAVVTGAGSGIGAAAALALAGDGWRVVLAGRRRTALEEVADRGAGLPGGLDPVPTDVTDEASVAGLFDARWPGTAGSICCSTTPGGSRRPGIRTRSPSTNGMPSSRST